MTRDEEAAELRRVNRQNTIDAYKRLGKEPPPLEFDSEEQHKERAKAQALSPASWLKGFRLMTKLIMATALACPLVIPA